MLEKNDLDRSMHRYYQNRAPEYDDWYDRHGRYNDPATNAAWHSQVAELGREAARFGATLSRLKAARALDLACGTGKWTPYFVHGLPANGHLVAFDYSPAMLELTRERLEEDDSQNLERTSFVRGDAYALPFADHTFDFVFFGFWLSHIPRERTRFYLNEVRRVMKVGGNLLIFDSALRPGRPQEEIASRPLNDGAVYDVLKITYSAEELERLLGEVFNTASARQTRDFFVIGQANN